MKLAIDYFLIAVQQKVISFHVDNPTFDNLDSVYNKKGEGGKNVFFLTLHQFRHSEERTLTVRQNIQKRQLTICPINRKNTQR